MLDWSTDPVLKDEGVLLKRMRSDAAFPVVANIKISSQAVNLRSSFY